MVISDETRSVVVLTEGRVGGRVSRDARSHDLVLLDDPRGRTQPDRLPVGAAEPRLVLPGRARVLQPSRGSACGAKDARSGSQEHGPCRGSSRRCQRRSCGGHHQHSHDTDREQRRQRSGRPAADPRVSGHHQPHARGGEAVTAPARGSIDAGSGKEAQSSEVGADACSATTRETPRTTSSGGPVTHRNSHVTGRTARPPMAVPSAKSRSGERSKVLTESA